MTTADEQTNDYGDGSIDDVAAGLLVAGGGDDDDGNGGPEGAPAEAEEAQLPDEADAEYDGEQDEADDTGQHQEDEAPEPLYAVKVDGEEKEVTLEELKRSYSGQGYIQKRMQEVAAHRKEVENIYAALIEERAQAAAVLQQYGQQLQQQAQPTPPDRALLKTDPIRYIEQEAAYREAVEKQQLLAQQQAFFAQQQAQQAQIAQQAYLREQTVELERRIPDLTDAKKAGEIKRALAETGMAYGYSQEELQGLADARAAHILYDAMQWRRMQANRSSIADKVQGAGPVLKPTARRTDGDGSRATTQKVRARMKQTGSVDDVAAYLLTR